MISPERIAERIVTEYDNPETTGLQFNQFLRLCTTTGDLLAICRAYLALLAEREETRRPAFEEAAKVAENLACRGCEGIARRIRALSSDRRG